MRAVVITGPHQVEIADLPDPRPKPDEIILAVAAAGICGTDLHILHGEYAASLPIVPGHEFAGSVVEVGSDVTDFRIGDRVAADPNLPCWRCRYCREGRVNLCENYAAVGVTRDGASAEYVAVPAAVCVRLAEGTDLVAAALAEPLACALHAFDLLGPQTGRSMLIYGSGTMGLMALRLAQLAGLDSVDLVDPQADKLIAARELGCSRTAPSAEAIAVEGGWDVVVDASGAAAAIQDGLRRVRRGGTFLQFGVSSPDTVVEISPFRIYDDELRIIGSVCPADCFPRAVHLVESGDMPSEVLVSDRLPIAEYEVALQRFAAGASRKIMIVP
jgi:2-desacetyl-2-hydroxyethyl bacteriochlorophyllide A dehydrogenase